MRTGNTDDDRSNQSAQDTPFEARPIIVLLDDKDCYPEPLVDGFVVPPTGTSLEEGFDLLEKLSERYRQSRNDDETDEALIDFVIRHGFTEVEKGQAGWFIFRDR